MSAARQTGHRHPAKRAKKGERVIMVRKNCKQAQTEGIDGSWKGHGVLSFSFHPLLHIATAKALHVVTPPKLTREFG